jgi:hypothetical protein
MQYVRSPRANVSIFSMAHRTKQRHGANHVEQTDLPMHMLGVATSRAPLRNWFVFTILTGAVLALVLFVLGNLIF